MTGGSARSEGRARSRGGAQGGSGSHHGPGYRAVGIASQSAVTPGSVCSGSPRLAQCRSGTDRGRHPRKVDSSNGGHLIGARSVQKLVKHLRVELLEQEIALIARSHNSVA